ncbi:p-hydroxybenzoic acid efflux pump subunit AaeB [Frankliniella fusca]|uniref:p-hydroxybenzoic acid efflux pump subunit AaeB n=1 Tax=Frankliniella fusca TaxID=407009 RepID=A0AAE1GQT2_9NEOP|nr:p-hydroxybenzoic acid efflux pump subunit AaeB [Frankliniella fusca]
MGSPETGVYLLPITVALPTIEQDVGDPDPDSGVGPSSTRAERRERFERAKTYFKKLEDPSIAASVSSPVQPHSVYSAATRSPGVLMCPTCLHRQAAKPLVCRSVAGSSTATPTRPRQRQRARLPNAYETLPLEVHSAPASDTDTACRRGLGRGVTRDRDGLAVVDGDRRRGSGGGGGGSERVAKVADRFHVKDVFQDVLGEGRTTSSLRGTPHRKAVLAALSSMDSPGEATSPYDSVADGDGTLLRKSFEDLDADADADEGEGPPSYSPPPPPGQVQGAGQALPALPRDYHKEYPYLSTTPITAYRPRSGESARLHLIPRKDLLDMDL